MKGIQYLFVIGLLLSVVATGCISTNVTQNASTTVMEAPNGGYKYSTYMYALDNDQIVFVVKAVVYAGHGEEFTNKAYGLAEKFAGENNCEIIDIFQTPEYPDKPLFYFTMSCKV